MLKVKHGLLLSSTDLIELTLRRGDAIRSKLPFGATLSVSHVGHEVEEWLIEVLDGATGEAISESKVGEDMKFTVSIPLRGYLLVVEFEEFDKWIYPIYIGKETVNKMPDDARVILIKEFQGFMAIWAEVDNRIKAKVYRDRRYVFVKSAEELPEGFTLLDVVLEDEGETLMLCEKRE